jgi:hypothetical protein
LPLLTFNLCINATWQSLLRVPPAVAAPPALRPKPGVIEAVLKEVDWPADVPFSATDFSRLDEGDDAGFYDSPKLVQHVDDRAVRAMEGYYDSAIRETASRMYGQTDRPLDVLDLGASWCVLSFSFDMRNSDALS